jgi:hypothetical protein
MLATKISTKFLKNKARRTYLKYRSLLDQFSCGASLAETITPRLYALRQEFNKVMDQLAEVDPATPVTRL